MFEKVSRSLKYDSNIFFVHKHIYIYMDTTVDHFTPLALRVRGNNLNQLPIHEIANFCVDLLYIYVTVFRVSIISLLPFTSSEDAAIQI